MAGNDGGAKNLIVGPRIDPRPTPCCKQIPTMNQSTDRPPVLAFLMAFCGMLAIALCLASIAQSLDAAAGAGSDGATNAQLRSTEPPPTTGATQRAHP
jgi:hypothetical protein